MTGVCLAIPGWIGSPGHLWTPAAGADREPKTTVATLTSTCSLPSAARLCQTEINYPGESYCTAEHKYIRHTVLSQTIYIFSNITDTFLSFFLLNQIVLSLNQCHFHISSHPFTFFLLTYQSLLFSQPFFSFLSSLSLWNNKSPLWSYKNNLCFLYLPLHVFIISAPVCSFSTIIPKGKEKDTKRERERDVPLTHI